MSFSCLGDALGSQNGIFVGYTTVSLSSATSIGEMDKDREGVGVDGMRWASTAEVTAGGCIRVVSTDSMGAQATVGDVGATAVAVAKSMLGSSIFLGGVIWRIM